jgi:hypothetical protein
VDGETIRSLCVLRVLYRRTARRVYWRLGHIGPPEGLMSDPSKKPETQDDRRTNVALRALIDEMLDRVRDLNRHAGSWDPEERARAEAELEAIMARVRRQASKKNDPKDEGKDES